MKKLFRLSTVPVSLNILLKGQLAYLGHYYDVTAISGNGKDLDEVAEREKVKVFPIEMQRQISPWKDFVALCKLYRYLSARSRTLSIPLHQKLGF